MSAALSGKILEKMPDAIWRILEAFCLNLIICPPQLCHMAKKTTVPRGPLPYTGPDPNPPGRVIDYLDDSIMRIAHENIDRSTVYRPTMLTKCQSLRRPHLKVRS